MSVRRLAGTTAAMALVALALRHAHARLPVMTRRPGRAQRTADTAGPDALVLAAAGLLAWAVWAWGAVGLALTAATALPGLLGGTRAPAPAGRAPGRCPPQRRPRARASGSPSPLPCVATAPSAFTALAGRVGGRGASPSFRTGRQPRPGQPARCPTGRTAPDAPSASTVPDWPAGPDVTGAHVVVRGDCLWHIAAARLLDQLGRPPDDGEVAAAVQAWWRANADVIGPDPDLLLPGQVLLPPERP